MGSFSPDGQRIGIQIGNRFEVWDHERNVQIYDSPLNLDTMVSNILFPDGRRVFGRDSIWDLRSGVQLRRVDIGNYYAVVNDSFLIAQYDGQLRYWRRRREEGSWSPLSFPEAWITGALAIACVCNVVLNSRGQRKRNEPAC